MNQKRPKKWQLFVKLDGLVLEFETKDTRARIHNQIVGNLLTAGDSGLPDEPGIMHFREDGSHSFAKTIEVEAVIDEPLQQNDSDDWGIQV